MADLRAAGRRMADWADEHCLDLPSDRTVSGFSPVCEETIAHAGMLLSPSLTPDSVPITVGILEAGVLEAMLRAAQ